MSLSEERLQILKLLEEGKITAAEAAQLLAALDLSDKPKPGNHEPTGQKARWLRIRVTDQATGRHKVNVNLPMGLVNVGMKIGSKFAPEEMEGIDIDEVIEAIKNGAQGKIVEVEDHEDGERIEIYVE